MTKRNIFISTIIAASLLFSGFLLSTPAMAAGDLTCKDYQTSIIPVPGCDGEDENATVDGEQVIIGIVKMVIQIMTALIGVVAVGAVIYGAILYGMSGGSPENVKKAKDIWTNVAIGLLLFGFLVAITNFLIPGGVF
ncbi:hypothetical protein B7Y94_02860 [Candidatus Saccharibacteria bacterium 32-49-12]|nr:MAG: hypothetical protein B7Y94_02860 [Candidatus Saccharibacteria bacterium 32-49-12]